MKNNKVLIIKVTVTVNATYTTTNVPATEEVRKTQKTPVLHRTVQWVDRHKWQLLSLGYKVFKRWDTITEHAYWLMDVIRSLM